jgi:hypothetical protein
MRIPYRSAAMLAFLLGLAVSAAIRDLANPSDHQLPYTTNDHQLFAQYDPCPNNRCR